MNPFRAAVEAEDHEAIPALLAENVSFCSPVAFRPYAGRDLVARILRGAGNQFEDFRYEREIANRDGRDVALVFRARIGEREVHGCDFLHLDDQGLIDQLTVMVRPLSAAHALAERMAVEFETIRREMEIPA
jgi:SnoaL-like domain